MPFLTAPTTRNGTDKHLFCFLPTAFSTAEEIHFNYNLLRQTRTSRQKSPKKDFRRHWLLRGLTYILRNLELFPSLEKIDVVSPLYPALWGKTTSFGKIPKRSLDSFRDRRDDTEYLLMKLDCLIDEAKRKKPHCFIPPICFFHH